MRKGLDANAWRVNLLRQIVQLKDAIAQKQRELDDARSALDATRRIEAERRRALKIIDDQLHATMNQVHRQSAALYVHGEAQSRGMLSLGSEDLRFSGWRGRFQIPLDAIYDVQVGTSSVPPRAGIPVLGRLAPGKARECGALLLTVRDDEQSPSRTILIADLPDAAKWRDHLNSQRARQRLAAASRATLLDQRRQAESLLAEASHLRAKRQGDADEIARDLATLRAQLKSAERARLKSTRAEMDAALEEMIRIEREAMKRLDGSA